MEGPNRLFRFSLRQVAVLVLICAAILAWHLHPSGAIPRKTGRDLDVAIFGRGWFVLQGPSGGFLYTRSGNFTINANDLLVAGRVQDGFILEPSICVPQDWREIHLPPDGIVTAVHGESMKRTPMGRIQLATFRNPDGLREVLPNVYAQTSESGAPFQVNPGEGGSGMLRQGWIENRYSTPIDYPAVIASLVLCALCWVLYEVRKINSRIDLLYAQGPRENSGMLRPNRPANTERAVRAEFARRA